ncbi:hypothetical protein RJ639_004218 [Escallonia herrerae]|uniref:DUF4219 domain-containing protein n=1 Tax=Escallonia herrerae TaxID=1293975 RepID=A0AA88W3P3_9ASTE|nr:hypothetical protein RJ639_004218 [Escallonia herrerae]
MDNSNNSSTQFGVEKLSKTNYQYWRLYMKAYLQGQDLWDIVGGENSEIPSEAVKNIDARKSRRDKAWRGKYWYLKKKGKEEEKGHVQDWDTCLSATFDASESSKVLVLTSIDKDNMGEGLAAINYEKDWIHGFSSLFSQRNEHKGNNTIVIADNVHPMVNEGSVKVKATEKETDIVLLNSVYHFSVISWWSKKQATTTLSSTKAEYNAATVLVAQECTWLRRLVNDICHPIDKPVQIYCDNLSTILFASNPIFHSRTKRIEVHYHFIREHVLEEKIDLVKVDTNEQVADLFKKALAHAKFEKFRTRLGLVSQASTKGRC